MMDGHEVIIAAGEARLGGSLTVPAAATGVVVFAHGSGSSRFSPRNRQVAAALQAAGWATLLFDLLTEDEAAVDAHTAEHRFDIPLLGRRLVTATEWLRGLEGMAALPVGYFGASTGAAAALIAAARADTVGAVVSRGGRPDLAGDALAQVAAPTLLIVGGSDEPVIGMNQAAMARMQAVTDLKIVPGATHLFEEPGALEQVITLAAEWFGRYLPRG
jgi:putative phosphoribosyl transferase